MPSINTSFLKRLVKEDFDIKDQSLISKISSVFNPAVDQISSILNNGLAISNLNTQVKTLNISVDDNGIPKTNTSFATTLNTKCTQIVVGKAQNLSNSTTYPTTAPFITFSNNGSQIIINHVTGLSANDNWQLTITAYV